jgi:hypothetical protein
MRSPPYLILSEYQGNIHPGDTWGIQRNTKGLGPHLEYLGNTEGIPEEYLGDPGGILEEY